jgi:hypothetical protein
MEACGDHQPASPHPGHLVNGPDPRPDDELYTYGKPGFYSAVTPEEAHRRLAPFADTSPEENEEFLAWMDRGLARRARKPKHGGTVTGAPRAGEQGDRQ